MPDEHTVTACLVSFTQQNGFVDIQLGDGPHDREDVFSAAKQYFSPDARLEVARVTFSSGGEHDTEPYDMAIIYDRELHGDKRCPYLALKLIEKEKIESLSRDHYMDVIKSVEW